MPISGAGFLIANDLLTDCAYGLHQVSVGFTLAAPVSAGVQTVTQWDPALYVGAQIVVGVIGTSDFEVVTVTAVNPFTSFTATFANAHSAGEPVVGATFPVRQTTDPLYTQAEMLAYLSAAANDFLTDCPLLYAVDDAITVPSTQQNTALPSDALFPVRVAYQGYPLRDTSQANLDALNYTWNQQAPSTPRNYFRDKVPFQNIGIWPRNGNSTLLEVVYAQRQTNALGLADGFLIPDPFLINVFFKTLSFALSKDGETRNPAMARIYQDRYDFGVKIANMFLQAIQDPNLEMAS